MYTRLAFAVAAHLQPEILLVDEVLAVGDANFQKKCLAKMGEVAHEGRTVLFVSHNMTAIQSLCHRAIWLKGGKVEDDGEPKLVVTKYLKQSFSVTSERLWHDPANAPGNEKVRLHRASVRPADDTNLDAITVRTPLVIDIDYWNLAPGAYLNLSLVLYNEEGVALFNTGPVNEPAWHGKPFPAGLFRSSCYIPGDLLNDGTHRVQLYVVQDQSVALFRVDDLLVFEVLDEPERRSSWYGKFVGSLRPLLDWRTELLTEASRTV
jgi:homopolymeric O-antigen transport system ATP-binding protein